MSYLHALLASFGNFSDPTTVALLVGGTLLGVFVGVVPGLGGIVLLVVLLPFLYNVSPALALALLLGSHSAIYYAGSTTAILLNTPGAPESAATCIDGYAMTSKGHVGRALGISAAATTFGGWFGAVVLLAAIPIMVPLVTLFHPPEYFFLTILAVVLIGQLQSGSPTKGVLSGIFGFLLSFVGAAASTGSLRFTFGQLGLYNGINIAAAAIGLFAISQMFIMFGSNRSAGGKTQFRLSRDVWADVRVGVHDVVIRLWLTTRSAIIGVACGLIPGIGSTAANFLSYGYAMQSSKHPELFGTGTPEGIIAPEGSSISKECGALVPTIALGIPNGPAMAILLAAFSILGLQPGPSLVHQHESLVFWMVLVIAVSSLLASVLGLLLAPVLAQVTVVPGRVLVPFVLVLASIGTFASTTLLFQVAIMMAMGVVGLVLRRYGYSLPGVIVGLVLGTTAENNLILTQQIYKWRFIERPLTDVIIAAIVLVIALGVRRQRRAGAAAAARQSAAASRAAGIGTSAASAVIGTAPPATGGAVPGRARRLARPSAGELAVDLAWVIGLAWYVWAGIGYPSPAELAPVILGGVALAAAVFQLAGAFVPSLRRVTHGVPGFNPVLAALPNFADAGAGGGEREALASSPAASPGATPPVAGSPSPAAAGDGESSVLNQSAAVTAAVDPAGEPEEPPYVQQTGTGKGEAAGQLIAVGMAAVLLAGLYLFGYLVTVPVWTFLYFLLVRRWKPLASAVAGGCMLGAFSLASLLLTSVVFPHGLI